MGYLENKYSEVFMKNPIIVGTPSNMFSSNCAVSNHENMKSTSEFLKRHEREPNMIASNHLYKFNSQAMKKPDNPQVVSSQMQLPIKNIQEIFIEGKRGMLKENRNIKE